MQARCVGDLCLALLLEGFALDDLQLRAAERHPVLQSAECSQHLHRLLASEWHDACEAGGRHGASAAAGYRGRMSLLLLGWAALLAAAPPEVREARGLGFERILGSSVLRSPARKRLFRLRLLRGIPLSIEFL